MVSDSSFEKENKCIHFVFTCLLHVLLSALRPTYLLDSLKGGGKLQMERIHIVKVPI